MFKNNHQKLNCIVYRLHKNICRGTVKDGIVNIFIFYFAVFFFPLNNGLFKKKKNWVCPLNISNEPNIKQLLYNYSFSEVTFITKGQNTV